MATPKFIGNYGASGSRGHINEGVGIAAWPTQTGGGSLSGKSGDIGYIPLGSLLPPGGINQDVYFQSEVGVTIDFTLVNVALATSSDPEAQASVMWTNTQTVAANTIVKSDVPVFAALRVTFGGDGTLYILVQ
jgi:hypothetical protein